MISQEIISFLDNEFTVKRKDVFSSIMPFIDKNYCDYCTDVYKQFYQGIMLDNSSDIHKVACACFLSSYTIDYAISKGCQLLIVKHPLDWSEKSSEFLAIPKSSYEKCKQFGLSVYVIHSAIDRHDIFSPSLNLAKKLNLTIEGKLNFKEDIFGVYGKGYSSIDWAIQEVKQNLGINYVQVYNSKRVIKKIAIVSGGGDSLEYLKIAKNYECDLYITGIIYSDQSEYAKKNNPIFREYAKEVGISLIAAGHYTTDKYGMIKLNQYLQNKGIKSEFIPETSKVLELGHKWQNMKI